MNTLQAGDKAPMFTLQDQNGNDFSLEETLKEHQVLVYFYPKAMTQVVRFKRKTCVTIKKT